jgi:DUF4097 and DUF4098 domain-containing protein YvlB
LNRSAGLGFGVFLIALGLGWYIFTTFEISFNVFAWILIIAGAGIIVSSLISWRRPSLPIRGLVVGLVGGLILSLLLTSGFGFIGDITGGGVGPYSAEGSKSYSGLATVDRIYLEIDNINGPIRVSTWDKAEYSIELTIKAKGSSQQNAEENLADLKIVFDERVVQGQQRLVLKYDVPFPAQSRYSIEVDAVLPADALIDLDLDSSNGGIYLTDLAGDDLKISTSNAPLVFEDVYAESITGETSNGRIDGEVESKDAVLSTSNGKIRLTIPCTVSGGYDLSTSNGAIELTVPYSPRVGYDLDLSTSNAEVEINLSGLKYSQNQRTRKEAQSEGFSGKAVQIIIEASTSNGEIHVIQD